MEITIDPEAERHVLGGATFCESAELVAKIDVGNIYAADIIDVGFDNVIVFICQLLGDLRQWVANVHNNYHGGQRGGCH